MKKQAVLSVANKDNLVSFAKGLLLLDYRIISTSGTASYIKENLLHDELEKYHDSFVEVSDYTGFEELFNKRIKTLHTKIYAGILAQRPADDNFHPNDLQKINCSYIDLVAVNFPLFDDYMDSDLELSMSIKDRLDLLSNATDIGGPCMLRAAAKNVKHVISVCDPKDYDWIIAQLTKSNELTNKQKLYLAAKVYNYTSSYDNHVLSFLQSKSDVFDSFCSDPKLSDYINPLKSSKKYPQADFNNLSMAYDNFYQFSMDFFNFSHDHSVCEERSTEIENKNYTNKINNNLQKLKYGENPHQKGFFLKSSLEGDASIKVLSENSLSYNNYLDIDQGIKIIKEFYKIDNDGKESNTSKHVIAILKHTNVCCATVFNDYDDYSADLGKAFENLYKGDSRSAYGGVLVTSLEIDMEFAEIIKNKFFEVVLAVNFSQDALKLLANKKRQKQVQLTLNNFSNKQNNCLQINSVLENDLLIQQKDMPLPNSVRSKFDYVSELKPNDNQLNDLEFALKIVKNLKSNAIVICATQTLLGFGCGQTSRIDSCEDAKNRLLFNNGDFNKSKLQGFDLVLASDGFFPFDDVIELAASLNIKAIIAPKGSKNDHLVIEAACKRNIALVFTDRRYFVH